MAAKRAKENSHREDSTEPPEPNTGRHGNRNPGSRSTRNPKRAVSFAEPLEEGAEASDKGTPGVKKAVTVSEEENAGCGPAADRAAIVGVEGYYTCDGGCDRATVSNAYADAIIKAGGHFEQYEKPLLATLANGAVKPIISGFLLADLEVETPAGKVVLPQWHIDVMQGPTTDHLLYLGQREQAELNLKTFQEQLTEVAKRRNEKEGRSAGKKLLRNNATSTQVQLNGRMRTVTFIPGAQPRYKRKLSAGARPVRSRFDEVCEDGKLFVGDEGWQVQHEVKYLVDPRAKMSYVTTAALAHHEIRPLINVSLVPGHWISRPWIFKSRGFFRMYNLNVPGGLLNVLDPGFVLTPPG